MKRLSKIMNQGIQKDRALVPAPKRRRPTAQARQRQSKIAKVKTEEREPERDNKTGAMGNGESDMGTPLKYKVKLESAESAELTYNALVGLSQLPNEVVATELGVCVSTLEKARGAYRSQRERESLTPFRKERQAPHRSGSERVGTMPGTSGRLGSPPVVVQKAKGPSPSRQGHHHRDGVIPSRGSGSPRKPILQKPPSSNRGFAAAGPSGVTPRHPEPVAREPHSPRRKAPSPNGREGKEVPFKGGNLIMRLMESRLREEALDKQQDRESPPPGPKDQPEKLAEELGLNPQERVAFKEFTKVQDSLLIPGVLDMLSTSILEAVESCLEELKENLKGKRAMSSKFISKLTRMPLDILTELKTRGIVLDESAL
ncbi:hypothetical protein HOP50_08g52470 [Chloropicon primus]|nr:hypothetical protein HOP50_08g52470 [Chloropicon primus]